MNQDSTEPVEPQVVPTARPWPWAGHRTAKLRRFATGERRLMTFFLLLSLAMVAAILVVSLLTVDGFRPPLWDPREAPPAAAPPRAP